MNFSLFELKIDFFKKVTVPTEACEGCSSYSAHLLWGLEEEEAEKEQYYSKFYAPSKKLFS